MYSFSVALDISVRFNSNFSNLGGVGIGVGSDDLLERRANLAPQSMQWAIRSRNKGGRSGIAGTVGGSSGVPATSGGGGFIYIDPSSLRRSTSSATAVAAAAAAAAAASNGSGIAGNMGGIASEGTTMYTTAAALSRAFGIVIRQIADLMVLYQV